MAENEVQPHPVRDQLPGVQYCINSPPPWPEAVALGFQHYILTLGMTVLIPSMIVPQMGGGNAEKAKMIQSLLFVSGINTLLQSWFGTRLPTVIAGSYTYIIPTISIVQATRYSAYTVPYEIIMGFFGFWRNATRFFSPLSVAPYVTFTGLGLYSLGFPMYLNRYISTTRPFFDRFSMLFTVGSVWLLALILTSSTAYNHKPENTQNSCRTDRAGLVAATPWYDQSLFYELHSLKESMLYGVYFPYPFQWGSPTFNTGETFAMVAASFVSLFESTGTFYAAARYGSATPVPPSIISRGTGWVGVATCLNGMFGSVTGSSASVYDRSTFFYKLTTVSNNLGYVASAGLGFLQFCNLNNFRTKFVLGLSLFLGISIPQYFSEYYHVKHEASRHRWLNDILTVFCMSHTTIAALVALFLDLTLSREEDAGRNDSGLEWWEKFTLYNADVRNNEFYALPCRLDELFPAL
ncbi:hypothetical protein Lal_00020280 [Lupinus albus]|nr:hypothetical protein Lal_00020280 [Lupinus albus]